MQPPGGDGGQSAHTGHCVHSTVLPCSAVAFWNTDLHEGSSGVGQYRRVHGASVQYSQPEHVSSPAVYVVVFLRAQFAGMGGHWPSCVGHPGGVGAEVLGGGGGGGATGVEVVGDGGGGAGTSG